MATGERHRPRREIASWTARVVAVAVVTGAFFAFQNCSGPLEVNESDEISKAAEAAGFAYDLNFDQVAYMSCTEMPRNTFDKQTFFTFRVGAYGDTGLKLTDDFQNLTRKMKAHEKAQILSMSPINSQSQILAALRPVNDLQNMFQNSGGGTPAVGEDYMGMLDILGQDLMSNALLSLEEGRRLKYVSTGFIGGARLEASLYFSRSWEMSNQVRTFLQSQGGVLAATYADGLTSSSTGARSPADFGLSTDSNATKVYGRALAMTFAPPSIQGINGGFPQHVLQTVREVNLYDKTDTSTNGRWICPPELQLRIVRPTTADLQAASCREIADPPTQDATLQFVRRTLKEEDWFVDLQNRCVVPKKFAQNNCYGEVEEVRYDLSQACGLDTSPACVHFVSICLREN